MSSGAHHQVLVTHPAQVLEPTDIKKSSQISCAIPSANKITF